MTKCTKTDENLDFLAGIYNDVCIELGLLQGTTPNIRNIPNIFKRQPPQGIKERLVRLPE